MKNNQVIAIVVVVLSALIILLLTDPGKDPKSKSNNPQQNEKSFQKPKVNPEMLKPVFPNEPPIIQNQFLNYIDSSQDITEKVLNLKSLELFNFTEGLGVRAKHDIKKGQLLARSDIKSQSTTMNFLHLFKICQNFEIPKTEDLQHVIISLQILYEKYNCDDKPTFFKSYFDDISKRLKFETLGYFWKNEEVEELQGSFLKGMITRQRIGIEKLYQQAKQHPILKCFSKKCGKVVPWDKILTKQEFEWAFFVTFTRFFSATFNVKELNFQDKVKLLLPGVDYFNTNLRHNNAEQVISQQDFRVLATEDIKKGEQIYLKYWKELKPNELLLLTYGFCDESNPNSLHIFEVGDYFIQKFESLPNDEVKSRFEKILKKFELFGFQYIRLNLDPEMKVLQPEFLKLLRAFHLSIDQLEKRIDLDFISDQIENEVLKDAIEIIESKLRTYSTSLKQDIDLLKNFKGNSNQKCALILRKEEKLILENFINYLKNKISN